MRALCFSGPALRVNWAASPFSETSHAAETPRKDLRLDRRHHPWPADHSVRLLRDGAVHDPVQRDLGGQGRGAADLVAFGAALVAGADAVGCRGNRFERIPHLVRTGPPAAAQ